MRPTGRLHLGNYWGALVNYVKLQDEYDCFFSVVDWHMLTTGYEDTSSLQDNIREMVLDWLAAGVDPRKAVVFKQSDVPEHAELTLLLSMITPLSWLENNPTWKEQLQELAKTKESLMREQVKLIENAQDRWEKEHGKVQTAAVPLQRHEDIDTNVDQSLRTHGFIGYPVLQAADILMYGAQLVPVGKDQLPHLELSREIARKFNSIYGQPGKPVLIEPEPRLTETPKVPGLDGRKMSKSYGNAIDILETSESLQKKLMSAYTDPLKIKKDDPGHPEPSEKNPPGCTIYALHKLYSDYWQKRKVECETGQIGCVACKKDLFKSMEGPFAQFREKREQIAGKKGMVEEILADGARKARVEAEKTMDKVRRAMHLK